MQTKNYDISRFFSSSQGHNIHSIFRADHTNQHTARHLGATRFVLFLPFCLHLTCNRTLQSVAPPVIISLTYKQEAGGTLKGDSTPSECQANDKHLILSHDSSAITACFFRLRICQCFIGGQRKCPFVDSAPECTWRT